MQFDNEQLFKDILNQLDGLKKNSNSKDRENYSFRCLSHTDKHASAYIALNNEGNIVVGCRSCDMGLNTLLSKLGMDKRDYIIKDEYYYSLENMKSYIKEKNIGNVSKVDNNWVIDTDYTFEDCYFYTDSKNVPVAVKIKYRNKNHAANDKKEKKFVQRIIRENMIVSPKFEDGKYFDTIATMKKKYIYNYPNVARAIDKKRYVFLVEGEKDADTLNYMGLTATTVTNGAGSWYEDYTEQLEGANLVIIGDFDKAGNMHRKKMKEALYDSVDRMRILEYLPGIDDIPGQKLDITDWVNAGHSKKELLKILGNTLNVKNYYEMQELTEWPDFGIYSFEKGDRDEKSQICNFTIEYVDLIDNQESEEEFFILEMKVKNEKIIRRTGHVNVFNEVKSFRDFLGSSDLIFRGKVPQLIDLKEWIFTYKKRKTLKGLNVGGIRKVEDEWLFVTHEGTYDKKMNCKTDTFLQEEDKYCSLEDIEDVTKEEIESVYKSLIEFSSEPIVFTILGHIGAILLNGKYEGSGIKLNHLAVFGESGAGKSTMIETVMLPLLNYYEKIMLSDTTPFALMSLASTNLTLPLVLEEYKPSTFNYKKNNQLSNLLRNGYDRTSAWKGTRNQKSISYRVVRPFVIIGEEEFLNEETALKERSNIIYIAKTYKTSRSTEAILNLKMKRNKKILNKIGKRLVQEALNIDENTFYNFRNKTIELCNFKDRPLNTFTNTVHGLYLIWKVFNSFKVDCFNMTKAAESIAENIKENVLQGGAETKTQVEMMLELIDEAISNNYLNDYSIKVDKTNTEVAIHLPTVYPKLSKYIRDFNRDVFILGKSDFIKQLKKSKYLKDNKVVATRMGENSTKVRKCYKLDLNALDDLGLENITLFESLTKEEQATFDDTF